MSLFLCLQNGISSNSILSAQLGGFNGTTWNLCRSWSVQTFHPLPTALQPPAWDQRAPVWLNVNISHHNGSWAWRGSASALGQRAGKETDPHFQFSSLGGNFWDYSTLHSQLPCPELLCFLLSFGALLDSQVIQQGLACWLASETGTNSSGTKISGICHFFSIFFLITLIQGNSRYFKVPVLTSAGIYSL